jgi:hypothetical protein
MVSGTPNRDPMPTQGPGSAAGEVGDKSAAKAFSDGSQAAEGIARADAGDADQPPAASTSPRQDQPAGQPTQARTPVSFEPTNADEMYRYAKMLAGSTLLPRGFYDRDDKERKNPRIADVHFVLIKGQALGLHPQVAIGNINVIEGKAEIGATLMVALCLRSGLCEYFELVKSDERSATFVTKRVGGRREIEFSYSIEEAEQMGLLDKGSTQWAKENNQWRKQPRTMLRRRCQTALAREVYPDIVMGLYDHDELAEMRDRELALGINPATVIAMNGIAAAPHPALAERSEPDLFAKAAAGAVDAFKHAYPSAADPLKQRMAERREISLRRCSLCQTPLDPRDTDPCIACRPDDRE